MNNIFNLLKDTKDILLVSDYWTVNGTKVKLNTEYTKKNIFFESGRKTYYGGGVAIEENFSYRPTWLSCFLLTVGLTVISFLNFI